MFIQVLAPRMHADERGLMIKPKWLVASFQKGKPRSLDHALPFPLGMTKFWGGSMQASRPAPPTTNLCRRSLVAQFFDFFAEGVFQRVYAFAGDGGDGEQLQSFLTAEGGEAIEFVLRLGDFCCCGGAATSASAAAGGGRLRDCARRWLF